MKTTSLKINSLGETHKLASQIVENLKGGEVICLMGDLGVGKTYFVKFFAQEMGIEAKEVISPTFVYWRKHSGTDFKLNHFDFYRIDNEDEAQDVGLSDAFDEKSAITIIEWADKIASQLPKDRLEIHLTYLGETERQVEIRAYGKKSANLIKGVKVKKGKLLM